jgi:hypothetical protein
MGRKMPENARVAWNGFRRRQSPKRLSEHGMASRRASPALKTQAVPSPD